MLATQQIAGNNSGPFLRQPKIVVMHATRSTIATKTDAEELQSTLNWFVNPDGASSHWVLSELERVRVVKDSLIAWHSAYLNGRSWGIEMTQPTIDRPFTDGHYANAALIGQNYVSLGVAPVWLPYWDGGEGSGFVAHEDTIQGRQAGKSDPGPKFDRVRFIASLEGEMLTSEDELKVQEIAKGEAEFEVRRNRDNQAGFNEAQMNLIRQMIGAQAGGLSDEQLRKAMKDEIDLARVKAAR